MSLFEFIFALSAVVLGLALTHIAATVHKLLLAGRRVRWAPEPVLLTCIVLVVIVTVWLTSWFRRDDTAVTVGLMLLQVGKLLVLYVAAASCLPEPEPGEPVDLKDYYDRTRPLSFGALILSYVLFQIYGVVAFGRSPASTWDSLLDLFLYPAIYAALIFVRARWFNIALLAFVLIFYGWTVIGLRLSA